MIGEYDILRFLSIEGKSDMLLTDFKLKSFATFLDLNLYFK